MRRRSLNLLLAAAVLLVAGVSCADKEDLDTTALENKSFEYWAQKHLDQTKVAKQDNGMYIEFLEEGDPITDENPAIADTVVWVRMNYTATTLYNDVFVTRHKNEALKQGTFTLFTYYTPDYVFCGRENQSMIGGQYFAMKGLELKKPDGTTTKLRKGSKVKLYMPSSLAFGTAGYSDDQGYGGQYALNGTVPVVEELEIIEVVKNPISREEELVKKKAEDDWGLTVKDTIVQHLYLDSMFRASDAVPLDPSQLLTVDSTAKVWFIGKFLSEPGEEEFIFDTNIDTVYNKFHKRQPGYLPKSKTHSVLSYKPADDKDSYISAFYNSIPEMRRGRWYRIVFTSAYGYGASGLSAALQEQQEYYNTYMNYYYNSYYGSNSYYGNSYYDSYYNSYYNYDYYNYSTSSSKDEEDSIVTEIQPYTPLIFEIYIEADEDDE